MSYKVEVIADSSGKWVGNALRFATPQEANEYAANLFARWTLVTETRVVRSDDLINYEFIALGRLNAAQRAAKDFLERES